MFLALVVKMSYPGAEGFSYDEENHLLICLLCKCAVNLQTLDAHLRDNYRVTFPLPAERGAIAQWAKGLTAYQDF